jgi:fructokinase
VHGGTLGLFRRRTAEVLAAFVEAHDGVVSLDPNVRPGIIDDRDRWMAWHDRWRAVCHVYRGSDEDLEWIGPGRSLDDVADELLGGRCSMLAVTCTRPGADPPTRADLP